MTVSVYSVVMSIICSSVVFGIGSFLATYGKRVRLKLILLIYILGAIRLFLPVEIRSGKVIADWNIYPLLRRIGRKELVLGISISDVLFSVWGIVSIALLLRFFGELLKLRKIVAKARIISCDEEIYDICMKVAGELGYAGKLRIAVTSEFSTPVSLSFIAPTILIPQEVLSFSENEFVAIIKHELIHFQRRDVIKQRAARLLQCFFWWNPVVYLLQKCTEQMIELQCDAQVCSNMDEYEKLAYLDGILKVLKANRKNEPALGVGYAKLTSGDFMRRRFEEVLQPSKKQSSKLTLLLALTSVALFIVSYMFLIQPSGLPDEHEYQEMRETTNGENEQNFLLKLPDGTYLYTKDMNASSILTEEEIKQPPYDDLTIYEWK